MTEITERLTTAIADRYRIESHLGQGGMATVYLAHDVKHDRKVALKVLRPELAAVIGAERFLNEIKVTANLQHPHILPLHDSGEADTFLYYVMPYVEGDTLRDKMDREKQLGIDDAVGITRGVAAALDYAHRQGVIHRDIKPENILIHDGQPLVADFGIALAVSAAGGSRLTDTGLSIGTPHYMSPEQAMGDRELDARSDVYSLGAMLYEMLAGDPPYTGSTAQAIVAKVITEKAPPVTATRDTVPGHVAAAIQQALSKLPADRFSSAAGFAEALANPAFASPWTSTQPHAERPGVNRGVAWVAGLALVVLAGFAAWGWLRSDDRPVVRVRLAFPEDQAVEPASTLRLAISPDGARIAYVGPSDAGQQLWVRELDQLDARPLPGTEQARAPFFSPDGRSIAFFTGEPGDLKVASIGGGPPRIVVADSVSPWGGDWSVDDEIYFVGVGGGVWSIPALGGEAIRLSVPDTAKNESEHDFPYVLPDGKHAFVTIWRGSVGTADIGVLSLETGQTTVLTQGVFARYLPTGQMIYATASGTLLIAPFDLGDLTMGPGAAVVEGLRIESFSASPQVAVSQTGALLYQTGGGAADEQLNWVAEDGTERVVDSTWLGDFGSLAVSPDGSQLAMSLVVEGKEGVWVKQLDAGPLSRLTFEGEQNYRPAWHPDGRSVTFISDRSGRNAVWMQRADGSAPAELLVDDNRSIDEVAWSRDGEWLVYRTGSGGLRTRDIWAIRPGVDTVPRAIATSQFDEFTPALSPDGRWVAYVSQESGRSEVFVRPFPDAERARWQISLNGGSEPHWDPRGGRLFYRTRRGDMMAAPVRAGNSFQVGTQQTLFQDPSYRSSDYHQAYVVHPDGRRFILVRPVEGGMTDIVLVLNWFEELRGRARQ